MVVPSWPSYLPVEVDVEVVVVVVDCPLGEV